MGKEARIGLVAPPDAGACGAVLAVHLQRVWGTQPEQPARKIDDHLAKMPGLAGLRIVENALDARDTRLTGLGCCPTNDEFRRAVPS